MSKFSVVCPNASCGTRGAVDQSLAGKKIRCAKCGTNFVAVLLEQNAPVGGGYQLAPTCPSCGRKVTPSVVICVDCGWDFRTGSRLTTQNGTQTRSASEGGHADPAFAHDVREPVDVAFTEILATPFRLDVLSASIQLTVLIGAAVAGFGSGLLLGVMLASPLIMALAVIGPPAAYVIIRIAASESLAGKLFLWNLAFTAWMTAFGICSGTVSHPVRAMLGLSLALVVPNLRIHAMLTTTLLGTVRAFESEAMTVDPQDTSIRDFLYTMAGGLISIVGGLVGVFIFALALYFGGPVGAILGIPMALLLLYYPMGTAMVGAYRILDPRRVVVATLVCLPTYFPVLVFSVLLLAVAALAIFIVFDCVWLEFSRKFLVEILPSLFRDIMGGGGKGLIAAIKDVFRDPYKVLQLVAIFFGLLGVLGGYIAIGFVCCAANVYLMIARCAMMGLVLRKYRHELGSRSQMHALSLTRWLVRAAAGLALAAMMALVTAVLIVSLAPVLRQTNTAEFFRYLREHRTRQVQSSLERGAASFANLNPQGRA